MLGTFALEVGPDGIGGLTDAPALDQLTRHGAHHVVVTLERMNAFARELALHHQSHQHLLSHQPETRGLCRGLGDEELYLYRMLLSDAPRPARSLSQRVERIAGLVEVECWKSKKIQACFHQLRMTDHDFDAVFELLLVPKLSLERRHCCP